MENNDNKKKTTDYTPAKGSINNPYTEAEFNAMCDAGTWSGGYVEGYGYMGVGAIITPFSSDDEYSFIIPSEDRSNPFDDYSTPDNDPHSGGGGSAGGGNAISVNTGASIGNDENKKKAKDYPTPSSSLSSGKGIVVYSTRLFKTSKSTLSMFTAAAYDEKGILMPSEVVKGYFLERVINYEKAEKTGSNTAIRKGTYIIVPGSTSQKYKWYLSNVPGRSGIAIHAGNNYYDSEGCLMTGSNYTYNNNQDAYQIWNSKECLKKLQNLFDKWGNNNISIIITEDF